MSQTVDALDVTDLPELRRLAELVRDTGQARILRALDQDVAIVVPIDGSKRQPRSRPTTAQIEAVMAAAGGWKGIVDNEELKRNLRAGRSSNRPPVKL